jgi:hypothetical protein
MVGMKTTIPLAIAALLFAGCYSGRDGSNGDDDGVGDDDDDAGTADDGDGSDDDGVVGAESPAPSTRFFRLTHMQWENTVRDLFFLPEPTGLSDTFPADPKASGYLFDNNGLSLQVDQALWGGYQRAASDAAELATADPQILMMILPPDAGDDTARAEQFIREFGKRAYRRPLSDAEVTAFTSQWANAATLYSDEEPFNSGVRFVIETMLQSPHFLYRVETSEEEIGGVIPLSGWEVAQRMSYLLWNTMPDDPLFDAAETGALDNAEGVREEGIRMLDDPRAREVVRHFHEQLFDVDKFDSIAPAPAFFPDAPEGLGQYAQTEFRMFVQDIVLDRNGTVRDLFTSTETFVNADLATIYGVSGNFGPEFVLAQLDPQQRRGILTQIGFLAHNATSVNPDPIHRGVFVAKRLTCLAIAAPPDNVPPVPDFEGKTNRQAVEEHTQAEGSTCVACHGSIINPYGFPFEVYDAMGAWRTEDNDMPVDASSEVAIGSEIVAVDNAIDLAEALAASSALHECYLRHWIAYANGRPNVADDTELVQRLGELSLADASVRDVLLELVTSKPFLSRAVEELP